MSCCMAHNLKSIGYESCSTSALHGHYSEDKVQLNVAHFGTDGEPYEPRVVLAEQSILLLHRGKNDFCL